MVQQVIGPETGREICVIQPADENLVSRSHGAFINEFRRHCHLLRYPALSRDIEFPGSQSALMSNRSMTDFL